MATQDLGKTSCGMQANVAAGLSYLLIFVTGIVFYLIEKENKFVRFHAMQSIIVFGFLFVVGIIVGFLPGINLILSPLIGLASLILWIVLMIKGFQGEYFKLPVAGNMAEKNV